MQNKCSKWVKNKNILPYKKMQDGIICNYAVASDPFTWCRHGVDMVSEHAHGVDKF